MEQTKTKKIYQVRIDAVDDIEKFRKDTGDKSEHIELIPDDLMLLYIKKAVKRSDEMRMKGVYISNSEIIIPILDENEKKVW